MGNDTFVGKTSKLLRRTLLRRTLGVAIGCALLIGVQATGWAQDNELPPDADTATPDSTPAATPDSTPAPDAKVKMPPAEVVGQGQAAVRPPTVVIGVGAGAYFPTSALGPNFLVGLDVAYALPWLEGKLGVGLGLAYSQPTTSGEIADSRVPEGTAGYDSMMRELVLDLMLSYRVFSWDSVWSPHAGFGPVIYLLSHEVDSLSHSQTETSTQVSVLLTLGADYRLWKGALVGEVRIPFATVGQKTTGDSNVGAVAVVVGYRLRI